MSALSDDVVDLARQIKLAEQEAADAGLDGDLAHEKALARRANELVDAIADQRAVSLAGVLVQVSMAYKMLGPGNDLPSRLLYEAAVALEEQAGVHVESLIGSTYSPGPYSRCVARSS